MFTQHYSPVRPHNTQTRLTLHLWKSNTTLNNTGICIASKGLPVYPNSAFICTPVPPKGYGNSMQASPLRLPQTHSTAHLHPGQEQMLLSAAELPLPVPCPKHHSSLQQDTDLLTGPFQLRESLENETKKDKMQV